MSMTKLTLSADKELVERAKALAAAHGTSLSSMFSRLMECMLRDWEDPSPPPNTRAATGLVSLPPDRSDADLLADALASPPGP